MPPPTQNEIVTAITNTIARLRRIREVRRSKLRDLLIARDCPDRFVEDLAGVVGFSDDLRVSARVTTPDDWRRIVDLAPGIWGSKGEHEVYRRIIRALCGTRSWIGDWFSFRAVAGASLLPYFATGPLPSGGEYVTNIHIEDLEASTIDRDMAEDALDLVRLGGETLELAYVLAIENWDNAHRWTQSATGVTLGTQEVTLDSAAGDSFVKLTEIDPMAWDDVVYNMVFHLSSNATADDVIKFRLRDQGADHYQVEFGCGASPYVRLLRGAGVVATAVGTLPSSTTPAAATGTITTVAGASLVDGETFTIDDGWNVPTVFEFDLGGGGVAGSNVAVAYGAGDSADDVRDAIIAAAEPLYGDFGTLLVRASDGGPATVTLTHDIASQRGNQTIGETVAAAGFVVTGMAGGGGPIPIMASVETRPVLGSVQVRVVVDGTVEIAYTDVAPPPPAAGPVWFLTQGGDVATVEWFEVMPHAPELRTING